MSSTLDATSTNGWSSWLRSRNGCKATRYLGIDVGVHCVRVVTMGKTKASTGKAQTQKLSWLGTHKFDLPFDPFSPPPADWVQQVVANLSDQLPRCVDVNEIRTSIAMPLSWVHYQVVSEDDPFEQECNAMFRASLLQSDAHIARWPLKRRTGKGLQRMIAATSENAAFEIALAVSKLGYRVENILPRGAVLAQAAKPLTNIDARCVVLLQASGGLVLASADGKCGMCRKLPELPPAEQSLSIQGRLSIHNLSGWISTIASEVEATIRYADPDYFDRASSPVIICGDIASIDGVDETFATLINKPVATWAYTRKKRPVSVSSMENTVEDNPVLGDAEYATALSLAQHTAANLGADG